jgi:hypothetical protein
MHLHVLVISLSNRNGFPMLLIDYDIDNRLIGNNLLITISTILSSKENQQYYFNSLNYAYVVIL